MYRKKPFSGKKKKEQLKAKRRRKRGEDTEEKKQDNQSNTKINIVKPTSEKDKLRTVFEREPDEVIKKRIEEGRKPLNRESPDVFKELYSTIIDIPKRPEWNRDMTKEEVEGNEERMFKKYLEGIYERYSNLNYFEHNLEVWRELWRTCEMSDILLIVADIRHPMFHFPPALYNYVTNDLKKPFILVLTKCDLVPKENIIQWKKYFEEHFPKLKVAVFCSYQKLSDQDEDGHFVTMKKKRRARRRYRPTGVEEILDIINSFKIKKKGRIVQVDYTAPNQGSLDDIMGDEHDEEEEEEYDSDSDNEKVEKERDEALQKLEELELQDDDYYSDKKRERSYITLGLIGNPNVGKSTFINAMKGYRVCSTSRTPGHTKRRQTIFLTKDLMLCDCPGLVFPAVDMPRQLQILCGIFPIAQVREPYSAIKYLAECIPVEKIYNLEPIDDEPWSAWKICEAYAEKRGYRTKSGRLDTHRAGREILFDVIDGRIVLYFLPNQAQVDIGFYINSELIHNPLKREDNEEEGEEEEEEEGDE